MEMEDERRMYHHKRRAIKADSPLGHRYSNAIGHLEQKAILERNQKQTLKEIAELEFEAILE